MKKILALIAVGLLFSVPAFAGDHAATTTGAKTYSYNNQCALGIGLGKTVACDASHSEATTWTDPKTHKEYCFSSAEMKTKFAADITGNLAKAETNWTTMEAKAHTGTTMH